MKRAEKEAAGWEEIALDAQEQRDLARQRLRDVVQLAAECERNEDGPYPEEVMEAAGYERCERCGGRGFLVRMNDVFTPEKTIQEGCDCINGWMDGGRR
jgi:hypothetical protein